MDVVSYQFISVPIVMIIYFLSFILLINVVYHLELFAYEEPLLYPWNEPHLTGVVSNIIFFMYHSI